MDFGKRRGVEFGTELTLTHTRSTSRAEVPIYFTDVFCSEERRGTSLLNVLLVVNTITITVTYYHNIRGYACPNTVHQPFLIVLA
ncbi:MAG: hypothetical protein ABIA56_01050, partial [Actinomycetota bacterium]